jgi:polyribonucleotide nucleotidyltransferase
MASVMGASLALAEAGIPIPRPVAGVSVGLFESDGQPLFFTDLTEDEDHASLFDLKVTGTSRGLTALQLDIKASHLNESTIAQAITVAHQGILTLIETITPAWADNRRQNDHLMSTCTTFNVHRGDVGRVIGSGGKNLKTLQNATRCRIELSKRGTVAISGPTIADVRKAVHTVSTFSLVLQPGRLYAAQPGTAHLDGLHITVDGQLGIIPNLRDVLSQNHMVLVRYLRKRDDGVLEFERIEDNALTMAHAMNAPVKDV